MRRTSAPRFLSAALAVSVLALLDPRAVAGEPVVGGDLSFLPQLASLGVEYREGGLPIDLLASLRAHDYRVVRLRLWHSPDEPWNALDSTIAFAKRAKQAGFSWMLDVHYSDTWADPGHQAKPAAWSNLPFPSLVDSVYAYTNAVIRRCRDEDVLPAHVQIGNEIDGGFLWDDGRVGGPGSEWDTPGQWTRLCALLDAASRAVRDSLEPEVRPEVILHLAQGGNNAHCRWFFDRAFAAGIDFDAIGVSYYPWWHGTLTDLAVNLHDLASSYGKGLWIVETSYPWTLEGCDSIGNFVTSPDQLHPGYEASPGDQLEFLRDLLSLVRGLPGGVGKGVIYWEPEFLSLANGPPNPCENLTLFDFDGDVLPGLGFAAPRASSAHETIQVIGDFNGWDENVASMRQVEGCLWMDTVEVGAGCHLLKFRTGNSWDVPLDYGGCSSEDPSCEVERFGSVCLVAHPGTALGRIDIPAPGEYVFRLDERDWTYRILPLAETGTADAAGRPASFGISVVPNPIVPSASITLSLPESSDLVIAVYDVGGRRVKVLAEKRFPAGEGRLVWDGRDDSGRDLSSGFYFVRAATMGHSACERVLLLR